LSFLWSQVAGGLVLAPQIQVAGLVQAEYLQDLQAFFLVRNFLLLLALLAQVTVAQVRKAEMVVILL
jgi:hypothetical protein